MKRVLGIILVMLIGYVGMGYTGYYVGQNSVEPQQVIESTTTIKFIPVELREFEDEAELAKFLNERDRTIHFVSPAILNDYDNFAQDLVKQARALGYDVWLQWWEDRWQCMARVDGIPYLIDPAFNTYQRIMSLD